MSIVRILIIALSPLLLSTIVFAKPKTALVIHGGAGVITRENLSAEQEAQIRAELNRALDAGNEVLTKGGSALDAVIAAISIMEDSPHFNAGRGAVFTGEGEHELDASLMEGHTLRAGAVAGVMTVRHPIQLARKVMDDSPHVMLAGRGAERFADLHKDIERVRNTWFDTERRKSQLDEAKKKQAANPTIDLPGTYFGTVGAVALDAQGHIAAATSTGGMTNKRWNRIGDSPVIGAGTYANKQCGVSATGWGEFYIRTAAAHNICARLELRGDSLQLAADTVINHIIPQLGGNGGAIAMDAKGNIAMPFNTAGMYRGWIKPDGSRGTAMFTEQ